MLDLFLLTFAPHCCCNPYIMACLKEPWPSAWTLNQNAFLQDPLHLWMATGREKLTVPSLRLAIPGDIFARLIAFLLYFLTFLPTPIKQSGIQTPRRWLFCDRSLPLFQSTTFPNKVILCLNTSVSNLLACRAVSRASLDSGASGENKETWKRDKDSLLWRCLASRWEENMYK